MKSLLIALSMIATVTAHATSPIERPQPVFEHRNSSFLSGRSLVVQLLNDGAVHAKLTDREEGVTFDEDIAYLDERALTDALAGIALVKPEMQLRPLTDSERQSRRGCGMDSSVGYSVIGKQFKDGRLRVLANAGCGLVIGLKDAAAAQAIDTLVVALDRILDANYKRIYGR